MAFKAKAFPFPVLQPDYSNYLDSEKFEVKFGLDIVDKDGVREQSLSSTVTLKNDSIRELVIDGSAQIYAEVFVKETITRHLLLIGMGSSPVDISAFDLVGTVEVTGVIVLEKDLPGFSPENTVPEFAAIGKFDLLSGDILAYSQTEYFEVELDHNAQPDLLRIQPIPGKPPHYYDFMFDSNVITISVSTELMKYWKKLKQDANAKHFLFTNLYRDCIEAAVEELKSDIHTEKLWFKVLSAQLTKRNIDLDSREAREIATEIVFADGFGKVVAQDD